MRYGFGDVVVGPDLDAEHDVELLVGELSMMIGVGIPRSRKCAADVDPGHSREHHVEKDHVGPDRFDGGESLRCCRVRRRWRDLRGRALW